mmetsp:Transcript_22252/g.61960  ORF Transcript_22252/g.61960 Transcript_22252/m.61960 type:complete len:714 (-) Transcript_22252:195-2336(-)
MGFRKLFHRSYAKVQPTPNSFSFDEKSVSSNDPQKRGSARFKWSYTRSSSANDSNGWGEEATKNKTQENTQNNDNGNDNDNNDERHGTPPSQPPLSPLASPELPRALLYFEIMPAANFNRESVKKKYKRLSLVHHPDRNGNAEKSIQEMQRINHYYDVLEGELDRLEGGAEDDKGDPLTTPRSSSSSSNRSSSSNGNDSSSDEDDDRKRNEEEKDKESRKNNWRSSRGRSSSVPRRHRSKSTNPNRERRHRRRSREPKENRRRCTSTQRRQRQQGPQQERRDMEQGMKRERDEIMQKVNDFRRKQRKLRLLNNQRSAMEKLDTDLGRDKAFNAYTKQVQIYRNQIELMKDANSNKISSEQIQMPSKPNYTLMECCNEDAVVAMRLRETGIAIEIVHQEISNATEEWILMKMRTSTSTRAGPGIYESTSKRGISVEPTSSYCKRILRLLTRPLDKDGNSILHYAVYIEDHEMISYLIQVARQNKSFARFVGYMNYRKLNAFDFTIGCTWDNSPVPSLMATATKEAIGVLNEKQRRRASRHRQDRSLYDHPVVDSVFNIFMCLVVGRYVTCSGWVISCVITVSAHWVELWNKSTPALRISKAFFFTLHTGWYLLGGILLKSRDLMLTVGDNIPIPWQLQIVGVLTLPFIVNFRYWPVQYILRATIHVESVLIGGLEWIISQNGTFSNGYTKHLVDYTILSVPFLAIQLFYAMNLN